MGKSKYKTLFTDAKGLFASQIDKHVFSQEFNELELEEKHLKNKI